MDEIQDCIADAQFGEVLRSRETTRPTMRMPKPPAPFDPIDFARSRRIDFESALRLPVGVYMLSRYNNDARHVYTFLSELEKFKRTENPGLRQYNMVVGYAQKLPYKYKAKVAEISVRISTQVLPSLRSTPSLGRLDSEMLSASNSNSSRRESVQSSSKSSSRHLSVVSAQRRPTQDEWAFGHMENYSDGPEEELAEEELQRKRLSASRHRNETRLVALGLFDRLRDRLLADQRNVWKAFCDSSLFVSFMEILWYCEQPVTLDSFNIFRDLGRGAFGVVSGAKFRVTGSLLALKCMNKKLVKGKNALKLVRMEREVLATLGEQPSPFTVYLKYSWQDKENFYLALPLCTGGDLQYQLANDRYFEPDRARFHIAEVVLGLAHLHSLGILYRDLKPDNILLDEQGHCRISDMGLAMVTGGKPLRGRAGTPGYWSPEMISKKRYSYPSDWWSLGVVLYELLAGRCPFSKANTRMERDDATLRWPITFPEKLGCGVKNERRKFPSDAIAFISALLDRDKNTRLGSGERGAEDVKDDPYFAKINWARLSRRELESNWKPRSETINAFNQSDIDNKSNDHEYRKLKLEPGDMIPDFEYTSKEAHQEDIVAILKMRDQGKLEHLERGDNIGCCTIA
mmetsp:Transcript_10167/g.17910  ORF Transcript_10167/g.17910 Transcript_10167/m.17910 type:complete len:629 (+) Transcript_10167:264-2150(+)